MEDADQVGDLVAAGHFPVRFDLGVADLASPTAPAPIYVRVRRVAFLVQFVERLADWFQEFVSGASSHLWLECDQLGPVPWQYPAGALYDLLAGRPRPWRLHVRYATFPSAVVMNFNSGANSARAHFLNSLKQAAFIMFGTAESVCRLPLERIQELFDSLSIDQAPTRLDPSELNGDRQRRCLPVRFLTVSETAGVWVRQRPLAASEAWTIASAFQLFMGSRSANDFEFVSHGAVLSPESDLNLICSVMSFYDMFVYISCIPRKGANVQQACVGSPAAAAS